MSHRNQKEEIIIPFLNEKPFKAHASYLLTSLEPFPLWSMALPIVSLSTSPSQILASLGSSLKVSKEGIRTPLPLSSYMASVSLTFATTSLTPPTSAAIPKPKIPLSLQPHMPMTHSLTTASQHSPSHHTGSLISSGHPSPWPHYVPWTHLHSIKTVHHKLPFTSLFKKQLELFFFFFF